MNKIETFLKLLRLNSSSTYDNVIEGDMIDFGTIITSYYSLGNCGKLPEIIQEMFPDVLVKPVVIRVELGLHVVSDINGKYYDIFGEFPRDSSTDTNFIILQKFESVDEFLIDKFQYCDNYEKESLINALINSEDII
ncbi:hypothetical protein [Yersinia phage vB_Yru_GN1]|uniref:Uncharacterized protein n=1 Tax=Yersinia phage vB_Yru_GN1 TaxID=3074381 RepID=A0AA86M7S3_9CAUD|nr:hypothetical protein [Yersinia phage vB_Yru_GN1]